jgi:hypothetical protein
MNYAVPSAYLAYQVNTSYGSGVTRKSLLTPSTYNRASRSQSSVSRAIQTIQLTVTTFRVLRMRDIYVRYYTFEIKCRRKSAQLEPKAI